MDDQAPITGYFEQLLQALNETPQQEALTGRLRGIAAEIAELESALLEMSGNRDAHLESYIRQLYLLTGLIRFQKEVIHFKSAAEMTRALFAYLRSNIAFEHGFIHLKSRQEEDKPQLVAANPGLLARYQQFLDAGDQLTQLYQIADGADLATLLETLPGEAAGEPWQILEAGSAIVFPLRMKGELIGCGVLAAPEGALTLKDRAFIDLMLGQISLLLYHFFYFLQLKEKLARRVKLQKFLDEVKYAEYFDKGPLYIYSLDQSGVILHANAAGIAHNPVIPPNAVGDKFINFLPPAQRVPFEDILHSLQTGEVRFFKSPMHASDTATHIWEFFITGIRLNDRFQVRIVFAVDITGEYYREQQAVHHAVMGQIGQFTRGMTGHLNNLLTVLVPNVSLMKTHLPSDHELQKHLQTMEKSLHQAGSLVRKFLNYNLPTIEHPKELDLNGLVRGWVSRYRARQEGIDFQLALDPQIPPMRLFPKRIMQLLKILVQNSVEASGGEGTIRIVTRQVEMEREGALPPHMFFLSAGSYVELCVEDHGSGINPAHLKHIFKPFFSTKIKNDGLGLGLFVAYTIVKDLGGEIFVKSVPNSATAFYAYLPLAAIPAAEIPASEPCTAAPEGKSPLVLVIDDEYNIRSVLKEVLELNGCQVYTAANGKEGVDLFAKHGPQIDLVVLDMMMPVMDGKEAFKEIKRRKKEQKIIVMSGFSRRDDMEEIMSNGTFAFLNKPFQIDDIVEKVQPILA